MFVHAHCKLPFTLSNTQVHGQMAAATCGSPEYY